MKTDEILSLLPQKQQDAIILEALTLNVRSLANKHSTLGAFMDSVTKSTHWDKIRALKLNNVFVDAPLATTRRRALDTSLLDTVVAAVKKKPGLRAEQIYMAMPSVDRHLVKSALAKLRANGAVRTKGNKRSTTYTVA